MNQQNVILQNNGVNNNPFEIFNYQNLGQVRTTLDQYGMTWFSLPDVCSILDLKEPHRVASRINDPYRTIMTVGVQTGVFPDGSPIMQNVSMNFVNEPGLYQAIGNSRNQKRKSLWHGFLKKLYLV